MEKSGPAAFAFVVSTLVPAAWDSLVAGDGENGPAAMPPVSQLDFGDGRRVEATTDRTEVDAGGDVRVRLTGLAARPCRIPLRVTLKEDTASLMSRIATPPVDVETRMISLAAGPGEMAREVVFHLPRGGDADPILSAGRTSSFTVVAQPTVEIAGAPAAAIPFVAHAPSVLSLEIERAHGSGGDAEVRVVNRSRTTLRGIRVNLGATGLPARIERVRGPESVATLAPGESATLGFSVAPDDRAQPLPLIAYAWAEYGGQSQAHRTMSF